MSEPKCDLCGGQHATLRYTEIDEGRTTKRSICRSCAQSRGLLDVPTQPLEMVQMLLASAKPHPETSEPPDETADHTCDECGQSFAEFRRNGRLGCGRCYAAFEPLLVPLMRQLHPRLRHVGKAPRAFARKAELRLRLTDLRGELDRAVRSEDYERAARLRDEIRDTERDQARAARGDAEPGEQP